MGTRRTATKPQETSTEVLEGFEADLSSLGQEYNAPHKLDS